MAIGLACKGASCSFADRSFDRSARACDTGTGRRREVDRRRFLTCCRDTLLALPLLMRARPLASGGRTEQPEWSGGTPPTDIPLREAMYWEPADNGDVRCLLCFRACRIRPESRGYCGVRVNVGGALQTMVHGNMSAVTYSPVEKKPLHHYLPGALANNYGTAGCNLHCLFCHNWHMSQRKLEDLHYETVTAADALDRARMRDAALVSFTYNEPTTFYEFMLETAERARASGLRVNVNTNGLMREAPMRRLMRAGDSATVDLKAFDDEFYRDICGGSLSYVLDSIEIMKDIGVWVEVVNLVIPELNDESDTIRSMCRWIVDHAGADVPLHVNRFVPAYRLTNIPSTPVATLERAHSIAVQEGLHHVYIGNVPGHRHNSTYCHACGAVLIHRVHYSTTIVGMQEGQCRACGTPVPGVWT